MATCQCDWKCLVEQNLPTSICQNCHTSNMDTKFIEIKELIINFNKNLLSDCIIFAGLEPFLQFDEMYNFIKEFRATNSEDVVIFTGYYENEISEEIEKLKDFKDIIVKFGRFIANSDPIYDKILGINLASSNQYAVKIS